MQQAFVCLTLAGLIFLWLQMRKLLLSKILKV